MAELSSREVVQRKIADALDYLGENLNIVDKSVREGKATNMDIARSFTGDVKSDKFTENVGLLDFTPIGTYFAGEEADKAITEAEPDKLKRTLSLLSFMNNPVMTTIARPDIGIPAIELGLSTAEAIPLTALITKPARKFLSSLKAKATKPSTDVGMNIQKTSLPISGEANTTTNLAENPSRRRFFSDMGAIGSATMVGGALASLPVDKITKAIPKVTKTMPDVKPKANILTFSGKGFEDTLAEIAIKANFKPMGSNTFRVNEMNDIKMRLDAGDDAPNDICRAPAGALQISRSFTKTGRYEELEKSLTGRAYMEAEDLDSIDSIDDVIEFVKDRDIENSPYFKKP